MAICEAPSEPACDKVAVSTVQHQGQPVRVCAGHRKRALEGGDISTPLARRSPKGQGGALAVFGCRVPAALKAAVEAEAARRGLEPSAAGHQALALWLATPAAQVLAQLGEALPEKPPRRRRG